jgi:hypothetical protein
MPTRTAPRNCARVRARAEGPLVQWTLGMGLCGKCTIAVGGDGGQTPPKPQTTIVRVAALQINERQPTPRMP